MLTPNQIEELQGYILDRADIESALISPEDRQQIGVRFPPRPDVLTSAHPPGMRAAIADAAHRRYISLKEDLHVAICDQWRYCERRSALSSDEFKLALGIAESLQMKYTGSGLPILALSAYLVKRHLLDELCECDAE